MQKTRKHCCLNADIHVIYSYIETGLQPFRGGRPLILDNAQRWIQPPSQIQRRAGSRPHADPALRWIQTQGRSSTVLDLAPMQIQRGAGSSTVLDPALRWLQHCAGSISSTSLDPDIRIYIPQCLTGLSGFIFTNRIGSYTIICFFTWYLTWFHMNSLLPLCSIRLNLCRNHVDTYWTINHPHTKPVVFTQLNHRTLCVLPDIWYDYTRHHLLIVCIYVANAWLYIATTYTYWYLNALLYVANALLYFISCFFYMIFELISHEFIVTYHIIHTLFTRRSHSFAVARVCVLCRLASANSVRRTLLVIHWLDTDTLLGAAEPSTIHLDGAATPSERSYPQISFLCPTSLSCLAHCGASLYQHVSVALARQRWHVLWSNRRCAITSAVHPQCHPFKPLHSSLSSTGLASGLHNVRMFFWQIHTSMATCSAMFLTSCPPNWNARSTNTLRQMWYL